MKTRLLKRLRREARTEYPYALLSAFAEYVGCSYGKTRKYIQELLKTE